VAVFEMLGGSSHSDVSSLVVESWAEGQHRGQPAHAACVVHPGPKDLSEMPGMRRLQPGRQAKAESHPSTK
jgi:hypothetical protein